MIRLLKKLFKIKQKVSIQELYDDLKRHNKNQLVRELIVQSQLNNKNQCGVEVEFKKDIKKQYSKKQIIKAIILLRLENNKRIKRQINKLVDQN